MYHGGDLRDRISIMQACRSIISELSASRHKTAVACRSNGIWLVSYSWSFLGGSDGRQVVEMTTKDGFKRILADRGLDGDKGTKRLLITPYIGGDFRFRLISTSEEVVRVTVVLKLDDTPLSEFKPDS